MINFFAAAARWLPFIVAISIVVLTGFELGLKFGHWLHQVAALMQPTVTP